MLRWRRRSGHWRSSTPRQGPPLHFHRMSRTRSSMNSVSRTPTCRVCFPQHCPCTSKRRGRNYSTQVVYFLKKLQSFTQQRMNTWKHDAQRQFIRAWWHVYARRSHTSTKHTRDFVTNLAGWISWEIPSLHIHWFILQR